MFLSNVIITGGDITMIRLLAAFQHCVCLPLLFSIIIYRGLSLSVLVKITQQKHPVNVAHSICTTQVLYFCVVSAL